MGEAERARTALQGSGLRGEALGLVSAGGGESAAPLAPALGGGLCVPGPRCPAEGRPSRSGLRLRGLLFRLERGEPSPGPGERPLDRWRPSALACAEEGDELLEEPEGEDIACGEGGREGTTGREGAKTLCA